jgi:hypothetical protein
VQDWPDDRVLERPIAAGMSDKMGVEKREDDVGSQPDSSNGRPGATYYDHSKLQGQPLDHVPVAVPYAEHGAAIDHQNRETVGGDSHPELWWSKMRHKHQDVFSEFLGVFIMILFGDGVVAQVVLANGEKGAYQSITWGKMHCRGAADAC